MFGFDDILDWLTPIVDSAVPEAVDAATTLLTDVGDFGGAAGDWFLDTATGEIVSAADMQQLMDLDVSGSGAGINPDWEVGGPSGGPTGASTSDYLRSLQADPSTPGSEPFHGLSTPYNYPDASSSWLKPLAKGLSSALGGLGGGGLTSLVGQGGGEGLVGSSGPGVGLASPPGGGGGAGMTAGGGFGGGGGLTSLPGMGLGAALHPGSQDTISALLSRLQAEGGPRVGMQAPIPVEAPVKFTPLSLPGAGGGIPMARPEAPPMSALQRLLAERRG